MQQCKVLLFRIITVMIHGMWRVHGVLAPHSTDIPVVVFDSFNDRIISTIHSYQSLISCQSAIHIGAATSPVKTHERNPLPSHVKRRGHSLSTLSFLSDLWIPYISGFLCQAGHARCLVCDCSTRRTTHAPDSDPLSKVKAI